MKQEYQRPKKPKPDKPGLIQRVFGTFKRKEMPTAWLPDYVDADEPRRPALYSTRAMEDAIMQKLRNREWFLKTGTVEGRECSIGTLLTTLEWRAKSEVLGGHGVSFMAMNGDKVGLGAYNSTFGTVPADKLLAAGQDAFRGIAEELCYGKGRKSDNMASLMKAPKQDRSDELLSVLYMDPEDGRRACREKEQVAEDVHRKVAATYMDPANRLTICTYASLVREPGNLVRIRTDFSRLILVVKKGENEIDAVDESGKSVVVKRDGKDEYLSVLVRTAEEQGSGSFMPELRKRLGIGEDLDLYKAAHLHAPENGLVSGKAFAMSISIDDAESLEIMRRLLMETEKGLTEVLTNQFAIRGENTFFNHYGANFIINIVERAMDGYAKAHGDRVRIIKIDHQKYVLDMGDEKHDIREMRRLVNGEFKKRGVMVRIADTPATEFIHEHTPAQAAAELTDMRLGLDWEAGMYGLADRVVSTMSICNDKALRMLLADDYDRLALTVRMVQAYPAIRKAEDLIVAFRHAPEMLALMDEGNGDRGEMGKRMEAAFRDFVVSQYRKNTSANLIRLIMEHPDEIYNGHTLAEALDGDKVQPEMKRPLKQELGRVAPDERSRDRFAAQYARKDAAIPEELDNFDFRMKRLMPLDRSGLTRTGMNILRPGAVQMEATIGSQPNPAIESHIAGMLETEQAVARVLAWIFSVRTEDKEHGLETLREVLGQKQLESRSREWPEYARALADINTCLSMETLPALKDWAREIVIAREEKQLEKVLKSAGMDARRTGRAKALLWVARGDVSGEHLEAVGSAEFDLVQDKLAMQKAPAVIAYEVAVEARKKYLAGIAEIEKLGASPRVKKNACAIMRSIYGEMPEAGESWVHHEHDWEVRRLAREKGMNVAQAALEIAADPLGPTLAYLAGASYWAVDGERYSLTAPWSVARGAEREAMREGITGLCAQTNCKDDRDAARKMLDGCEIWFLARAQDGTPLAFAAFGSRGGKPVCAGRVESEGGKAALAAFRERLDR